MEKTIKTIYYVSVEKQNRACKEIPIYKVNRLLSYEGGGVQLYFSLLPEILFKKKAFRKKNRPEAKLMRAINRMKPYLGQDEEAIIFSEELERRLGLHKQLPAELYAVCLKQTKPKHFTLVLPEDTGPLMEEKLLHLIEPYLLRISGVDFCGEANQSTVRIENYLYKEYGIPTSYQRRPAKGSMLLGLSEETKIDRYALENGIYYLNRAEVLKFLDTIVKNGYNTKVN